ncbi:MAG TPA: GNAT family protein [Frateuria sp.]|uniref:GNAT family N-acetyltransferase n=1 Tax=Frateuria sp. TaxID=2211372 RepID=UPI002D7EC116|nr:GNAT family protein [Frateuria sp.]HET6804136.1 GNAT family protein [Frateuria sp.]
MTRRFDQETLTCDGWELRDLVPDDIAEIVCACQDQLIQKWLPLPRPYTHEVGQAFVCDIAPRQHATGVGIVRAIDVDGRLGGVIDLKKTDWASGVTEIGYWVAPWARGRGLAGVAARVLADWALTTQGMERVTIHAATENIASQKAAQSAGFTREGIARSAGFTHDGRVDLVVFGRIKADLN